MGKTETMNQKYIDKYISELQDSRFYMEDDVVREVYYNPDSDAGGQFVTNLHSPSSVIEAHEKCLDNDTLWGYLESSAKQYLTDISDSEFMSAAKSFIENPFDFKGNSEKTTEVLYKWATGIEQTQSETDIKMGGM